MSLIPAAILPPVSLTPGQICHRYHWYQWCTLTCDDLREFSKKLETVLMQYSGAGRKLIHQKNQKQKISWHCPFKLKLRAYFTSGENLSFSYGIFHHRLISVFGGLLYAFCWKIELNKNWIIYPQKDCRSSRNSSFMSAQTEIPIKTLL